MTMRRTLKKKKKKILQFFLEKTNFGGVERVLCDVAARVLRFRI